MAKIPKEVISHYDILDVDVSIFLEFFDLPDTRSKVLCVGNHDEVTGHILTDCGMDVLGIDLREYDKALPKCTYQYYRHDFCDLPKDFEYKHRGTFDRVVALSCIEHFGFGTYNEGRTNKYYDVIACRKIWEMLKVGGLAYITVPFGSQFMEVWPHWRCYDYVSASERLVQDFKLHSMTFVVAGPAIIRGRQRMLGELVTNDDLMSYTGMLPHVTGLLVLEKEEINRIAPNGR